MNSVHVKLTEQETQEVNKLIEATYAEVEKDARFVVFDADTPKLEGWKKA